jgi:U3 small nucleolar RNA-associated protein 13
MVTRTRWVLNITLWFFADVSQIWALALSSDEKTIVSGGADSIVNLWQDCSAEEQKEETAKMEKQVAE